MVGSNSDSSVWLQAAEELFEVGRAKEASFVVAFFWPRVGEIDVEAVHGIVRYEISQKDRSIGADNPNVFQSPSADTVNGISIVFTRPFDTEEVLIGQGFGLVEQESGLADADFDMNRA